MYNYVDGAGLQQALEAVYGGMAVKSDYTISIATSDWATDSNGGYSCTKTVTGLLTTDNVISDVVLSTDRDAAMLQLVAWECLIDGCIIVTAANTVKFWCYNTKPTVALTVGLQVIR